MRRRFLSWVLTRTCGPGNLIYKTKNTPKVVGGVGKDATEVIAAMYRSVLEGDVCEVSSPAVAEMEKILENTYRNINIGLVNELTMLCNRMGISMWEVIDLAKQNHTVFRHFIQARPGWALYSIRSILFVMESEGIWIPYIHDRKFYDD